MGQFLVVQGGDPKAARELFERGLAAFQSIHGARPDGTAAAGPATHVAKFARKKVPGTALLRDAAGDCALAVGAFVSEGAADDAALRPLTGALRAGGPLLYAAQRGLDGYFVLVSAGGARGDVAVMTDRVGGLHAYEARASGCALISTSSLVLAALTGAELDETAVRELLGTGSVFEQRSLFRGVEKLRAGTVHRYDGGELTALTWFSLGEVLWDRAPVPGTVASLGAAIVDAQRSLLGAYRKPILDLTGGFDSRNLLAAALKTGHPFGTVVNGQETDADVVAAGRIAAAFSLDHRNQRPGVDFPEPSFDDFERACALGDGEANVFEYAPTALVQARTAGEYDLSVNGSFGELCRGYWWDLLGARLWSRTHFDARTFALGRFANDGGWGEAMTPGLGAPPLAELATGAVERTVADLVNFPDAAKADAVYVRMRMQRWGGRIVSLTSRIRPCAAPFMFRGPLLAALSMPPGTRMLGRGARGLIRHLNPRLAALPMDDGSPASPLRPWNAHRFVPRAAKLAGKATRRMRRSVGLPAPAAPASTTWRAGDVWRLPEMSDLLDPASMRTAALYDPAALAALVDRCRADRASPPATLGRIVTLELAARAVASARA